LVWFFNILICFLWTKQTLKQKCLSIGKIDVETKMDSIDTHTPDIEAKIYAIDMESIIVSIDSIPMNSFGSYK